MSGLMFIVSAPSGAGKTTLLEKLFNDFNELEFSVSTTTRKPRPNEVNGKDYIFITEQEFEEQKQKNLFAEWALVHGNYYGTSKKWIDEALKQKRKVVFDIDIQGASQLKAHYREYMVMVFIAPPSIEELQHRLEKRGEDSQNIQLRIKNAKKELMHAKDYDFIVINDDLNKAYEELRTIYKASLLRAIIRQEIIENML